MPATRKKKTTSASASNADAKEQADKVQQPREDKETRLPKPAGNEVRHFLNAVDSYQESLAATDTRIVSVTLPFDDVPAKHVGPHAGFPVFSGEVFEVKTNTGEVIR